MADETLRTLIFYLSALNATFLLMHEFDAFHLGEWKMLGFLKSMNEKAQYLVFLYFHIPFVFLLFYYLYTTMTWSNYFLWLTINVFSIGHFCIHIVANKWRTNVFSSVHSYVFIGGAALTSLANLIILILY